jgi:hypothetical protein
MDEDCLRLAAMDPHTLITDPEACATLLEIANHQDWTCPLASTASISTGRMDHAPLG